MSHNKSLALALIITLVILFAEFFGGIFSNSLALISDAGHMLTDVMALTLSLLAAYFAVRPATKEKTFGFYRLEILSALLNGVVLTLVAIFIFYEAYQRLFHPAEVQGGLMLVIAMVGLAANAASAWILSAGSSHNLNLKGAYLHVISDLISSVGVVIAGLIIIFTGYRTIDPIVSFLIGLLILRGALWLVYDSANILLESAPEGINTDDVAKTIKSVRGVKDLHDLHIWTITSGLNAISAHLLIRDDEADRAPEILKELNERLKKSYNISHSTFQTECVSCPEGLICKMEPKEEHGHQHDH